MVRALLLGVRGVLTEPFLCACSWSRGEERGEESALLKSEQESIFQAAERMFPSVAQWCRCSFTPARVGDGVSLNTMDFVCTWVLV